MFDPEPWLKKLESMRKSVELHNTRPDYIAAGYPKHFIYVASIKAHVDREPIVVLFTAPEGNDAARDRLIQIDWRARVAARQDIAIDIAALH